MPRKNYPNSPGLKTELIEQIRGNSHTSYSSDIVDKITLRSWYKSTDTGGITESLVKDAVESSVMIDARVSLKQLSRGGEAFRPECLAYALDEGRLARFELAELPRGFNVQNYIRTNADPVLIQRGVNNLLGETNPLLYAKSLSEIKKYARRQ
jgi:hypothetical protein